MVSLPTLLCFRTVCEDLRKSVLQQDCTWRKCLFVRPFHRNQSITGEYLRPTLKAQLLLPGSLSQWTERRVESCMFPLPSGWHCRILKLAGSWFLHLKDEGRELSHCYGSLRDDDDGQAFHSHLAH